MISALDSLSREELVYMAKVCEQTEKFEDMINYMKQVVQQGGDLSVEERNLLSVAYKNSIGSKRTAWRALEAIEQKEENKGGSHLNLIKEFKKKVQDELYNLCNDVLLLIDERLLKNCTIPESKFFFLKMKGDYYRYLAEFSTGELQSKLSQAGIQAYNEAFASPNDLKPTNPIRLGMALSFATFYHDILNNPITACSIAKQAFDDAITQIEELNDDDYRDSTTIMQMIRDNLILWSSEIEAKDEDKEEKTDSK